MTAPVGGGHSGGGLFGDVGGALLRPQTVQRSLPVPPGIVYGVMFLECVWFTQYTVFTQEMITNSLELKFILLL